MMLRSLVLRIALALGLAAGFAVPAFAQQTISQLLATIAADLPTNGVGAITAANLRTVLNAMVNSTWVNGTSCPTTALSTYQPWANTTSNPSLLTVFDGTSCVQWATLNTSTHVLGLAAPLAISQTLSGGSGLNNLNTLAITADTESCAFCTQIYSTWNYGGATARGARVNGFFWNIQTVANSGSGVTAGVGITAIGQTNSGDGGTGLSNALAKGTYFGGNLVARNAGTNVLENVGLEADTLTAAGASQRYNFGVTAVNYSLVQGSAFDAAYAIYSGGVVAASGGSGPWGGDAVTASSATVQAGGSGYTNGTQTLTLVGTGGLACATYPQISVTVSGNVVASVNSISNAGSCGGLISNPVAVSGGGGSGATLNITWSGTPTTGYHCGICFGELSANGLVPLDAGATVLGTHLESLSNIPVAYGIDLRGFQASTQQIIGASFNIDPSGRFVVNGATGRSHAMDIGPDSGTNIVQINGGGSGSSNGPVLSFAGGGTTVATIGFPSALFGLAFDNTLGVAGFYGLKLYTNNTLRMRILSTGLVGIGNITPLSALDVAGGVAIGSYAGANAAPSNGLIVSGAVGIGNSSPTANTLQVSLSGGLIVDTVTGAMVNATSANTGGSNQISIVNSGTSSNNGTIALLNASVSGISSGNVQLYAQGGSGAVGTVQGVLLIGGGLTNGFIVQTNAGPIVFNAHTTLQFQSNGTGIGDYGATTGSTWTFAKATVISTGAAGVVATLTNTAGSCTHTPTAGSETVSCSSDARLKTDIRDADPVLSVLMRIKVRDYTSIASGETLTGAIAQEVLVEHRSMVHVGADGFYTVDQPNPWVLLKGIQEVAMQAMDANRAVTALRDQVAAISMQQVQLASLELALSARVQGVEDREATLASRVTSLEVEVRTLRGANDKLRASNDNLERCLKSVACRLGGL